MKKMLSSVERPSVISVFQQQEFDLLVIGGGITGAGIALDAASRGMQVALIEQNDYASGTSSKSTKLIHGGLRYLKQLEINLVREVGRERAVVHRLAPHLVIAEKMLLPLVHGGTYGELATSMGLWVYDVLAGVEDTDKRVMLDREETIRREPLLRTDILKGGGYYAEYRTDDARLTLENIKTAVQHGAVALNYVQAEEFLYSEQGKIKGVICRDKETDQTFSLRASYVVNAAGPWVDRLRKLDGSVKGKHLFLSKGVHIVVPYDRFPIKQAIYFDVPDGRMVFAIPRHRVTYIGTTDTPYQGDLDDIPVYREDVEYLLDASNSMFPELRLNIQDVESSWAGLRPLIFEEGKSASAMSRRDEIFESPSGLFSIAGGKLTGYRKMAERIVDLIAGKISRQANRVIARTRTHDLLLSGGPFSDSREVEEYKANIAAHIRQLGLQSHHAAYLVGNFGRQTELILDRLSSFSGDAEQALARSEAWYTLHQEQALTLLDFFNRRTGRLYFNLPSIKQTMHPVAQDFARYLKWSDERFKKEKEELLRAMHQVANFEFSQNYREEQVRLPS